MQTLNFAVCSKACDGCNRGVQRAPVARDLGRPAETTRRQGVATAANDPNRMAPAPFEFAPDGIDAKQLVR